jgi:hypothetical protein
MSGRERYWIVNDAYREIFWKAIREGNERLTKGRQSPERLASSMSARTELGALAEEWVLRRERERLPNHPLIDQISRVSLDAVDLGYDIASFSTDSSLIHDRFIEVKSYADQRRFFWSSGEIEKAKELGEKYCLYLVDRRRLEDATYVPQIIVGPYTAFFEVEPAGWRKSPASYEFVADSIPSLSC